MANTTNFGWETPDDTDLVKDGAAAMRTLGNSIDASFVDLKGGTTGQLLSKASATDLDYTWIDPSPGDITAVTAGTGITGGGTSGAVTITNEMATTIDAKGDLIAGTGDNAFARLAVGTNNQVLQADSTTATGLKWGSISAGMAGLTVLNAGNQTVGTGTSKTWTGLGGYQNLIVYFDDISIGNFASFRIEAGNGVNNVAWVWYGTRNVANSTYSPSNLISGGGGGTDFPLGTTSDGNCSGFFWLMNANSTGLKFAQAIVGPNSGSSTSNQISRVVQGYESSGAGYAVNQIRIAPNTGNFVSGNVRIWGA